MSLNTATNAESFDEELTIASDRAIFEYVAWSIFQLRQQTEEFLPQMKQLASGPMGSMLGSLFGGR